MNPFSVPFYFHAEHNWLFVPVGSTEDAFYYFDFGLGWLFTNAELYPQLFSFTEQSWLRYQTGSERWFWHFNQAAWVQFPVP